MKNNNIEEEIDELELKYKIVNENKFRSDAGFYNSVERVRNIYKIVVVEARNLEIADVLTGTSDPYTVLSYSGQVSKTTIKKTNLNPLWKEAFEFNKVSGTDILELTVYDYDAYARDDIIGQVDVDMEKYPADGKDYDDWFYLENDGKKLASKIRLIITHITHGMNNYEKEIENVEKQMKAKEVQLKGVNDMIELTEKPFALFEIEKREKAMDDDISKALKVNSVESSLSEKLKALLINTPWIPILYIALAIYLFFTLLA